MRHPNQVFLVRMSTSGIVIPTGHFSPLLVAAKKLGKQYVDALMEQVAEQRQQLTGPAEPAP